MTGNFEEILCVILELSDPPGFDPQTDHFYPVPVTELDRGTGEHHLSFDLTSDTAKQVRDALTSALGHPSANDE